MRTRQNLWVVVVLTFAFVCNASSTKSQVIKVEHGMALTSLTLKDIDLYKWICPYQTSIGLDYMDKGWYVLSSNIGCIRKGGRDDLYFPGITDIVQTEQTIALDYLTLNTTCRIKGTSSDKYTFYAGVGPRLDILLKKHETSNPRMNGSNLSTLPKGNPLVAGLKCEVGFNYTIIGGYQIGVNAAWLPSFTHCIDGTAVHDRTFTIGLVFGYQLSTN